MHSDRAVIVADGRSDDEALRRAVETGALVIGADGGARRAMLAGLHVDLVVGDLDSLTITDLDELVAAGAAVIRARPDKDESDTELCLLAAVERGTREILVLGALGGERVDHELANIGLLADPRLDGIDVSIVDGPTTIRRMGSRGGGASLTFAGAADDMVTLLAIDDPVEGVTTHHLAYPLHSEPLRPGPARGLSNVMLEGTARIEVRSGRLLVIHTRQATRESQP